MSKIPEIKINDKLSIKGVTYEVLDVGRSSEDDDGPTTSGFDYEADFDRSNQLAGGDVILQLRAINPLKNKSVTQVIKVKDLSKHELTALVTKLGPEVTLVIAEDVDEDE